MCTQCCVDAQFYVLNPDGTIDNHQNFIPGWGLFRAKHDGGDMTAGQWGLVRANCPDFIWSVDPIPEPAHGYSNEEYEEAIKDSCFKDRQDEFYHRVEKFQDELTTSPYGFFENCWALIDKATQVGFNPDQDGNFAYWLFHRMGVWIQNHHPISHTDPRLNIDNEY